MADSARSALDVMLTTEGTYPTVRGGVSTWCDALVQNAEGVNYHIYTILGNPYVADRYALPAGVRVTRVPMWGTEEPTEHLDVRFSTIYDRKLRTTRAVVEQDFIPLFDHLVRAVLTRDQSGEQMGKLLLHFYHFFQQYDYLRAFKAEPVWNFFVGGLLNGRWTKLPEPPTLLEALQALGWLYRFFIVLNTPVPRTDVTHASAAAFCGLPGVLAKLEHHTPFLLTEHGVYLREQYLSIGKSSLSPFAKQFLLGLIQNVVSVNYAYADLVSPVAAFNARWEKRLGVPEERIRVIYNGVNPAAFVPRPRPEHTELTVVSVARIDPVKDHMSFIEAAKLVHEQMPDVKFLVYGSVSVPAYYQRCLERRDELGLKDTFIFAGHTNDAPAAYSSGDIVVLSSITEGFPYAVVEAMMSGRPVVATDVGGTREACAGVGLLVPPQNPSRLAEAMLKLLRDPKLRLSLAEEGRERALSYFTIQRNLELYRQAYEDLAERRPAAAPAELPVLPTLPAALERRRLLAIDRGQALAASGQAARAIDEYRLAVDLDPEGPSTPPLLLEIARLFLEQGDLDSAWREMERAEALAAVRESAA